MLPDAHISHAAPLCRLVYSTIAGTAPALKAVTGIWDDVNVSSHVKTIGPALNPGHKDHTVKTQASF